MRALLLLLVASSAHAGNNEITIGSSTRALRSPSADAVTADSLEGARITYARAIDAPVPDDFTLWAEASTELATASGTMFQTMSTDVSSSAYMVGARLRYQIWRRLGASARLSAGPVNTSLELDDGAGHTLKDHAWGALAQGALGVDLVLIQGSYLSLGARFELGYTEASKAGLTPRADGPSDGTLTLPMSDASIGKLDLSGPTAGFTVIGQF